MIPNKYQLNRNLVLVMILMFFASCAPKLTFYVTKPPNLPIDNVETISIGSFYDDIGQSIRLPKEFGTKRISGREAPGPNIANFKANNHAAQLVRGILVSSLSKEGQYAIANSSGDDITITGVIPDAAKTAILSAKVKYFEFSAEDSEKMFYLLLATQGGLTFTKRALLLAKKEAIIWAAEKNKTGFEVATPFVEKIAAMEVSFEMIRKSSSKKIIPTQNFRSYFLQKWGGNSKTTRAHPEIHKVITTTYSKGESLLGSLQKEAENLKKAYLDPYEFLAFGGKLKDNPAIPKNSQDIQIILAQDIVNKYIKQISSYTIETTLKTESGDSIAINYINGNAYELAINRLEGISRKRGDSYNLALSYEAIGEYRQARTYYQEALNKDSGNKKYQEAIKRVKR